MHAASQLLVFGAGVASPAGGCPKARKARFCGLQEACREPRGINERLTLSTVEGGRLVNAIERSEGGAIDLGEYDAVVAGGGLSGWAAAVLLARAGREVLLAAERTGLGHEVASALTLWPGDDGRLPSCGLMVEMVEGLAVVNAVQRGGMDPVATQVLLDRIATEAKVKLLLQVRCHCGEQGQVVLSGKWGTMAASARVIVDSTRDGGLALEAGAKSVDRPTEELPLRRALVINAQCEADVELEVGEGLPVAGGRMLARRGTWPGDVILEAHLNLETSDPEELELQSRAAMVEAVGRLRERAADFRDASLIMVAHETVMPRSRVIVGRDDGTVATQVAAESGATAVRRGALLPAETENVVLASPAADLGEISAVECYQANNAVRIGEAAGLIAQQLLEV
jgi:hypothetical protein